MEHERWCRVERLYHSALNVPSDQRSDFLKEQCQGDEDLHREVSSLLSYESSAKDFIEGAAFDVAAKIMAEWSKMASRRVRRLFRRHRHAFACWKSWAVAAWGSSTKPRTRSSGAQLLSSFCLQICHVTPRRWRDSSARRMRLQH